MDPILEEFLHRATVQMSDDVRLVNIPEIVKASANYIIDKYRDTPNVNPQTLTQIRILSNVDKLKEFLNAATLASEAAKAGIPEAQVAAVVEEALTTGTPLSSIESAQPILNRLPAESLRLINQSTLTPNVTVNPATAIYQAADIPTSARQAFSAGRGITVPSSVSSNPAYALPNQAKQLFEAGRNLVQSGGVTTRPVPEAVRAATQASGALPQVESSIAQAESVSPTVARSLTQTIMGAGSTALSGLAALGARVFGNRAVQGLVGTGLVGAAIYSANNPSETPAPSKSAPEIPIGPSAMQNLPSAAPTGPSADDLEYQKLLDQVNSMPENSGKYQAMGSLIVRRLTALETRRKELQTKLDSLDPTNPLQQNAYASTALLLRDTLTSIDKENDNWAKNEGLKRDQAKADLANSPENLDLERRAKEATIAAANASAAASQSSAANSAMQQRVNEFQLAQAQDLAPTVKAKAEADLAATQINLQVAEAALHKLQAEALQKDTVEGLTQQYNNGELTYEQYAEQVLTASGKVEELIRFRTDMLKDKHAQEQAAIQQGNWEKSFGLQQQQLALAQSEAEANAAFRKSQEERAKQAQLMQGAAKVEELRAQQKRDYQNAWNATTFLSESNLNNLKSFQTPMAAEQVATISGMDVNSPEFQKIYGIYSQMLASGPQNANTPAQPSGPQSTPSPVPSRPAPSTVTPQAPSFSQALAGMAPAPSPAPTPAPLVPMNMGPFTNALAAR